MIAKPPAPRRVLVVEDEPMVAEVVERYLRRDGYEVKMAGDGLGADAYVTNPFSPRELAARARAVLRRSAGAGASGGDVLRFGNLLVNGLSRRVEKHGRTIELTAKEFH